MACRFQPDPYTRRILQRVFELERDVNRIKQWLEEDEPEIEVLTTAIHPDAGVWGTTEDDPENPGWLPPPATISQYVPPQPRLQWLVSTLRGMVLHDDYKHRQVYPKDFTATVPEWWQVRSPQVPQAVVTLADVEAGQVGKSRWQLSIPHFRFDPLTIPPLQFQKGQWFGQLFLTDNSKILVNCYSQVEAERVIEELKAWVDPEYLQSNPETPPVITFGLRKGAELSQKQVKAIRVDYYPEGQMNTVPEWVQDLR